MTLKNKFLALLLAGSGSLWAVHTGECEPVDLFNKCESVFIVEAEYLLWTVEEGGVDYVIKNTSTPYAPLVNKFNGRVEHANFDWDSGFRASLGYFRAPHYWEAVLDYTLLHSSGKESTAAPSEPDLVLLPITELIMPPPISRATSDIFFHYNLANFIARRVFLWDSNPHLRLRAISGFTGTWMKQRHKIRYFGPDENEDSVTRQWRYWGVGYRAGISFDWYLFTDIYMTGEWTAAALVGRYHNRTREDTSTFAGGGDPARPVVNARYHDTRLVFTTQISLGPSYQKSIGQDRIEIFAGYELTLWANLLTPWRRHQTP